MPRGMPAAGRLPGVAPPETAVVPGTAAAGVSLLAGLIEWVAVGRVTGVAVIRGGWVVCVCW